MGELLAIPIKFDLLDLAGKILKYYRGRSLDLIFWGGRIHIPSPVIFQSFSNRGGGAGGG